MKFRTQSYFKQIGDTLPKILKTKLKKANFVDISVIENWKEIVGDDIAKHCWHIKITFSNENNLNSKIIIKVERGWSLEIEYKNQEIIEKLNQYFGYKAISKINIIQNFEEYTVESKKNKIEKKITKKKFFKEITNIKQPKLQKALLKLDKTLFKSE